MSIGQHVAADLFGLTDRFPAPGWTVLDAARAHHFTGELTFDTDPAVRLYLDGGRIYLAERVGDAPIGDRLVDAGALTPAQLEQGALRVGEIVHLGRLFDRVPTVDRGIVTLTTELMNDNVVAWVANQEVPRVLGTPYLHHPSGIHRWDRTDDVVDPIPGDPLPAPARTAVPLLPPPAPAPDDDPIVSWDTWLDERAPGPTAPTMPAPAVEPPLPPAAPPPAPAPAPAPAALAPPTPARRADDGSRQETPAAGVAPSVLETDWIDRLETEGLPAVEDPLAAPAKLPAVPVDRTDHFELIWPSGQIDEDFGAVTAVEGDDGRDRVGPTARVVRSVDVGEPEHDEEPDDDLWDFEATGPIFGVVATPAAPAAPANPAGPVTVPVAPDEPGRSDRHAEAAAEVETSPVDALATPFDLGHSPDVPGRVATRTETSFWTRPSTDPSTSVSVFDEVTTPAPHPDAENPSEEASDDASPDEPARVSALRRLIGGLRRR